MIRQAAAKDLMKIEKLLCEFYEKGSRNITIPYDRDSTLDCVLRMILDKNSVILINDVSNSINGMIGGSNLVFPLNYNYFYLLESFWYATDNSGMKLLKEFEIVAEKIGAYAVGVTSIYGLRSEIIDRILKRRGYDILETHYIKEI